MCDIARISTKRSQRVQCQRDCNRDVYWTRVLKSLRRLRGRSRLSTSHGTFWSCGIIDEMLQGFILRYTEVQIVKPQEESIPVLKINVKILTQLASSLLAATSAELRRPPHTPSRPQFQAI